MGPVWRFFSNTGIGPYWPGKITELYDIEKKKIGEGSFMGTGEDEFGHVPWGLRFEPGVKFGS